MYVNIMVGIRNKNDQALLSKVLTQTTPVLIADAVLVRRVLLKSPKLLSLNFKDIPLLDGLWPLMARRVPAEHMLAWLFNLCSLDCLPCIPVDRGDGE
jgi:hypothetical protein